MGRSQGVTGREERVLEGLGTFFRGPGEATGGKAVKRVAELRVWAFQTNRNKFRGEYRGDMPTIGCPGCNGETMEYVTEQ
jgi:hypothetical protein